MFLPRSRLFWTSAWKMDSHFALDAAPFRRAGPLGRWKRRRWLTKMTEGGGVAWHSPGVLEFTVAAVAGEKSTRPSGCGSF